MNLNSPSLNLGTTISPYGEVAYACSGKTIVALKMGNDAQTRVRWSVEQLGYGIDPNPHETCDQLAMELQNYFEGKLKQFTFSPVLLGTPFQQKVYQELMKIPYGSVITYGGLAEKAGRPGAARAVGTVMAKNRIALVIPCHRVVAAQGKLGGYGYGVDVKQRLLELEGWDGKTVWFSFCIQD